MATKLFPIAINKLKENCDLGKSRNYGGYNTDNYSISEYNSFGNTTMRSISELQKSSKSIRKTIRIIQDKKKEDLKEFHKNTILKKVIENNNSNISLINKTNFTNNFVDITLNTISNPLNTIKSNNIDKDTIRSVSNLCLTPIKKSNIQNNDYYSKSLEKPIFSDGLTNYLSTSKQIRKQNIIMEIKTEQTKRLEEEYNSKFDEINEIIGTSKQNKINFNEFLNKFDDYMSNLRVILGHESIKHTNMKDQLYSLQLKVKNLNTKVNIKKIELSKYEDIRLFLLSLKLKKKVKSYEEAFKKLEEQNTPTDAFTPNTTVKLLSRRGIVFSKRNKIVGVKTEELDKDNENSKMKIVGALIKSKEDIKMIYENPEDALRDMNELNDKVTGLIDLYNENMNFLNKHANKEKEQAEINFKDDQENKNLMKILKNLKIKNRQLQLEKSKISKYTNSKNEMTIIEKIINLYNNLYDINAFNNPEILRINEDIIYVPYSKVKKCFNKIETVYYNMNKYFEEFNKNSENKKLIEKIEKSLDKLKKNEVIKKHEMKNERDNNDLIEKMQNKRNGLVFKNSHKVMPKYKLNFKKINEACFTARPNSDRMKGEFYEYLNY